MNILRFANPLGYNALSDSPLNDLLCDLKNETYYDIPKANVVEGKDNFKLELSVPGFTKEQIGIQFQDHLSGRGVELLPIHPVTVEGFRGMVQRPGEKLFIKVGLIDQV